jgi:hypothetical protein
MLQLILVSVLIIGGVGCANPQFKTVEQVALERQQWEAQQIRDKAKQDWFKSLTPEQQVQVYKEEFKWQSKERIQQERTRGIVTDSALRHVYRPLQPVVIPRMRNPYADAIANGVYAPQPMQQQQRRCIPQITKAGTLTCF